MMTCLSGTLTRKERNRMGSQSLNITALLSYSTSAEINCSITIWNAEGEVLAIEIPIDFFQIKETEDKR